MTEKKQYAIADEVPDYSRRYLTAGKAYEIMRIGVESAAITDDAGEYTPISLTRSLHLDGGNWRIVDEGDIPEQKDAGT